VLRPLLGGRSALERTETVLSIPLETDGARLELDGGVLGSGCWI
jgi:hypothetical protein